MFFLCFPNFFLFVRVVLWFSSSCPRFPWVKIRKSRPWSTFTCFLLKKLSASFLFLGFPAMHMYDKRCYAKRCVSKEVRGFLQKKATSRMSVVEKHQQEGVFVGKINWMCFVDKTKQGSFEKTYGTFDTRHLVLAYVFSTKNLPLAFPTKKHFPWLSYGGDV